MTDDATLLREAAVVVLCGGQGSRMKSRDRHKVCFPVDGAPAIVRTVELFRDLGARKLVLVVGALAEDVIRTVGAAATADYPEIVYVYQHEQRGTGHAAQIAARALEEFGHDGPILVTAGDKVFEPRAIRGLAARFTQAEADLAFLTARRDRDGAAGGAGRIVTGRDGAVLGNVERGDLQRARLLRALARLAAKTPRRKLPPQKLRQLGRRYFPDEAKLRAALGPLADALEEGAGMTGARSRKLLGANPGSIELAGEALSPEQVERRAKTVNLSVYLGRAEFWRRWLPRLRDDNAQREFYLTDVLNLAAAERQDWKLAQHVVEDPEDVMAFNSPEQLLRIEDVFRRRRAARVKPPRKKFRPGKAPAKTLRPAGEWLALFQEWPAELERLFAEIYGPGAAAERRPLFHQALETFVKRFGPERPAVVARAPGRINLLGRHVDHRGGAINVMAIDRDVAFVAAPRTDDAVTLRSAEPRRFPERRFSIGEELGAVDWEDWLTYVNSAHVRALLARWPGDWSNYVKAALLRLQQRFRDRRLCGFDAAVAGDVPQAAGLSSSSALVVAAAEVAAALNGLDVAPKELVDLCGEGEWFVGSRGGAGDHSAIRLSRRGRLAHVAFHPFRLERVYDFPADCRVVIAHSGLDARKSASAKDRFNQKVACYDLGLMLLKDRLPQYAPLLEHLRDLNPRRLKCAPGEIYRALLRAPESIALASLRKALSPAHRARLDAVLASHRPLERYGLRGVLLFGLAECERSRLAPDLLAAGKVEEFGALMRISHDGDRVARWRRGARGRWEKRRFQADCSDAALRQLCRDLSSGDAARATAAELHRQPGAYGCSAPRVDQMVDIVEGLPGVYGAQLGGAGLGGCIMILLRPEAEEEVRRALEREYYADRGATPLIHACRPVAGSGLLAL